MSGNVIRMRLRGQMSEGPAVIAEPYITAVNFQQGVLATAHAPEVTPADAVVTGPSWFYSDNTAVPGASGSTYTFQSGDVGKSIYVAYEVTANETTIPSYSANVGPIQAPSGSAPSVADQTLLFGRSTRTGSGGAPPVNTGGTITSATIDSGANKADWQISANGTITPSSTGQDNLQSSYTLGCTFTNASGSDTATITISTEANAYDIGAADAITANTQMTNTMAHIGNGGGVVKKVYWRENVALTWSTAWFNSRAYTAQVTVEGRTRRTATATIPTRGTAMTAWNLIKFSGVNFFAPFLRNSMVASGGPWLWGGVIGDIEFYDCDLAGDLNQMIPGAHYMGWMAVSNSGGTDMRNANIRFISCDIHGMQRLMVPADYGIQGSPGPIFLLKDCDLYDMVGDGVFANGFWQSFKIINTYVHNPYTDQRRVYVFNKATYTWKRLAPWSGVSDGKKFFLTVMVDWQYNIASLGNWVIFSQGDPAAPAIKLWRDTSGKINVYIRDTSGNIVAQIQTANTYNFGLNCAQQLICFSIDTDRNAQLQIWRETDGGGGEWYETQTATTAGETLNLTSGSNSFSGLYDGSESGPPTNNLFMACRRFAAWHGQAPDLTAARSAYISDTTGIISDVSVMEGLYGTPTVLMDDYWNLWNTVGNSGSGGQWDVHTGITFDHVDLCQSAFNSTMDGPVYRCNILWSGFDTSAKYARPLDPDGSRFSYYLAQGFFGEDMNANHYQTALEEGNLIVVNNSYGCEPYNSLNTVITGNTCVCLPSWNPTDTASGIPNCRVQTHGSAPLTGSNTITDNAAQGVSSVGSNNDLSNNSTGVAPSAYSTLYVGGSEPTTRAELLAYFAPKPGGPLLTSSPLKRGAIDTYFNHTTGTADSPRSNTAAGVAVADLTGQTASTLCTSAAKQITAIYDSELAASANGGLVVVSGGVSPQFRVTSDAGGSTVVIDWTSSPGVMQAGQYLWLRDTSSASPAGVTSVSYRVGRTTDTWTITTA